MTPLQDIRLAVRHTNRRPGKMGGGTFTVWPASLTTPTGLCQIQHPWKSYKQYNSWLVTILSVFCGPYTLLKKIPKLGELLNLFAATIFWNNGAVLCIHLGKTKEKVGEGNDILETIPRVVTVGWRSCSQKLLWLSCKPVLAIRLRKDTGPAHCLIFIYVLSFHRQPLCKTFLRHWKHGKAFLVAEAKSALGNVYKRQLPSKSKIHQPKRDSTTASSVLIRKKNKFFHNMCTNLSFYNYFGYPKSYNICGYQYWYIG